MILTHVTRSLFSLSQACHISSNTPGTNVDSSISSSRRNGRFLASAGTRVSRLSRQSIQAPAPRLPVGKRLQENDQDDTAVVKDKEVCDEKYL